MDQALTGPAPPGLGSQRRRSLGCCPLGIAGQLGAPWATPRHVKQPKCPAARPRGPLPGIRLIANISSFALTTIAALGEQAPMEADSESYAYDVDVFWTAYLSQDKMILERRIGDVTNSLVRRKWRAVTGGI